jgi:hypothetical protein
LKISIFFFSLLQQQLLFFFSFTNFIPTLQQKMYQSYLFAKQKNTLSKYKKVASLATTEPDDTLSKKLLPVVRTVMSYASDFSSAGPSTSTRITTATGQGRSKGCIISQQPAETGREWKEHEFYKHQSCSRDFLVLQKGYRFLDFYFDFGS